MTKDAEGDRGVHRTRGNPAARLRLRMCRARLGFSCMRVQLEGVFIVLKFSQKYVIVKSMTAVTVIKWEPNGSIQQLNSYIPNIKYRKTHRCINILSRFPGISRSSAVFVTVSLKIIYGEFKSLRH